jgi:hypothetical protein
MKMIEINHQPGNHCASTGVRNIVNFHGIEMSEAMCFGIGEGLGLWYIDLPNGKPSRMVHVRSADFEKCFFTNFNGHFEWETDDDPLESEKQLMLKIDEGLPAIIQTDIFYLPYYGSKTHFPGHVITVWGYDREKEIFIVSDTERDAVQEVPMAKLRQARYCHDGIFLSKGNLYAPVSLKQPDDLPEIIKTSVFTNSQFLSSHVIPYSGKPAFRKWESEILEWANFEDWQWTSRFCYQIIEKRGTGGGGFRKMYAAFLKEASVMVESIKTNGLDQRMEEIAVAWTDLSFALKDVSEMENPNFSECLENVRKVNALEMSYHDDVVKIFQ